MFTAKFQKRVRYGETDKMGFLYYGNYPLYYEIGRVEAMRSLGFPYQILEDEYDLRMPVMYLDVRYIRPAYYDELITIVTTIRRMPDKDIVFHCELYNEKEELLNAGKVKLCFLDSANQRISLPSEMLKKLKPYFEGIPPETH